MPIVSVSQLKESFEPGSQMRSDYFMNLIDTLADDRNVIHVGYSEPSDASAVPLWFNDSSRVLSIFDGNAWVEVSKEPSQYNLPANDGLPGQVLKTDGNGTVTWENL